MKKLILLLIVLNLLMSFKTFATTHCDHTDHETLKVSPLAAKLAEAEPTGFLKVTPGEIYGFKYAPNELAKMVEAFKMVEAVINSEEFKVKVIGYMGSTGNRGFTSNNNLTNEQVYAFLMQGKELLQGEQTLGEMNFNVNRYYKRWSKVIGYVSMGKSNWINVNGKFYRNFDVSQMASNITHEWIHLAGFTHDSARDHDSVPYAVGYIMEDLVKKYMAQGYLN
jgi:hypothetical protein